MSAKLYNYLPDILKKLQKVELEMLRKFDEI